MMNLKINIDRVFRRSRDTIAAEWTAHLALLVRSIVRHLHHLRPSVLKDARKSSTRSISSARSQPNLPPPTMSARDSAPVLVHSVSSGSLHSIYRASRPATPLSAASSTASLPLTTDQARVQGLHNCDIRLSAKKYKTEEFAADVLRIVREVSVPSWVHVHGLLRPEDIKIVKVSGSLTNAVFFVSAPAHADTKTFLLRVYGPSSGNLISRSDELRMLHLLSSRYRIGPRLYGTFNNGRLEEYFDSDALTPEEMRDPKISAWIARRMAEMHRVDIDAVIGPSWTIAATDNVQKWLAPAREVLDLVGPERTAELGLDLDRFVQAWTAWQQKVHTWEAAHGASPRVFAHNDAQYGNLLKLRKVSSTKPAHHQIIVVDFEYAAPNPAAVDIANHFQEWTTAYNSPTPHLLRPEAYPSLSERRNFYSAYLGGDSADWTRLESQVRVWNAAPHGMWAIWSLVQAREQVEAGQTNASEDFDYLSYASSRLSEFYRLAEDLSSI